MKNLKLLTIAVVLAELMVVKHNVMAAEQEGTPMARKASAARRGGLMAFRKAVQNRQRSKQELTEARQRVIEEGQRATAEGKRADTAEMETLRIKIVSKIKETASLNAKRIIEETTSELQKVVENLGKTEREEITIDEKEYAIESVQEALDFIQSNIPTAAESAIRDIAIEKQAFDQTEKAKKAAEEEGWIGITFPEELKTKINGIETKDRLEAYLEKLTEQKEFLEYQNKLSKKGISYFWKALLEDSLGLELTEINPINEVNCLKVIGLMLDAAEQNETDDKVVNLNFNDTDSGDEEGDDSDDNRGAQGGVDGAIDDMFG